MAEMKPMADLLRVVAQCLEMVIQEEMTEE